MAICNPQIPYGGHMSTWTLRSLVLINLLFFNAFPVYSQDLLPGYKLCIGAKSNLTLSQPCRNNEVCAQDQNGMPYCMGSKDDSHGKDLEPGYKLCPGAKSNSTLSQPCQNSQTCAQSPDGFPYCK
jgi:hypothetical protein